MSLSQPKSIFGVYSAVAYNRSTFMPYGKQIEVIAEASLSSSGDLVELEGGASRYPWAVETGKVSAEISLKVRELPPWLFTLFGGKAPTENSAEASGATEGLANKYGTSVVASTGIATVTVKSGEEANVKSGRYLIQVASATTVNVYALSGFDFSRGTDKEFVDDTMKITSSALTIATTTAVEVPGFGVELTGGAGTIAMTTGDTAVYEVRAANTGSTTVTIGATSDSYPAFGLFLVPQKRGNAETSSIRIFNCQGIGLPMPLSEKAWATHELSAKAFYDATESGVWQFRTIAQTD